MKDKILNWINNNKFIIQTHEIPYREKDYWKDHDVIDTNDLIEFIEYIFPDYYKTKTLDPDLLYEEEIKAKCDDEIIKRMVEIAEGFSAANFDCYLGVYFKNVETDQYILDDDMFPLLIHRAIKNFKVVLYYQEHRLYSYDLQKEYEFKNYQPESLTQAECACLDCLIETIRRTKDETMD